ncbi:MAG: histidine kinase [Lachnospiraceae bacterium]|nr:histidine kinase [Lachnospiraceae bacterium]
MRKLLKVFYRPIEKFFNNLRFRHKFFVLYFSCVIIPLIVTDAIILNAVYQQEINTIKYDMEYVAGVYQNYFENMLSSDVTLAESVNMNPKINDFVVNRYDTGYDFVSEYYDVINDSFLETTSGLNRNSIVIYADNDTMLDSQFVKKLSGVYTQKWYQDFIKSGRKDLISAYYDVDETNEFRSKRKFYYVKRMDYERESGVAKLVVIGHDSSTLQSNLKSFNSKYPAYVIIDDYVVFSTLGDSIIYREQVNLKNKNNVVKSVTIAGAKVDIIIVNEERIISSAIRDNWEIGLLLIIFTVIVPFFMLSVIENTVIKRIAILENAFGSEKTNTFNSIKNVEGNDELASLMNKYNRMVDITNELVTTVYKDKIKEQESDIARQKAELLALQSQINPHFMFNALESIRMHSLLKGETETASMVDKLAVMERQNVEWGRDFVTIKKEIESIEAYLALQSYRFGDRLSFDIDVEKDCELYEVPKLTVVTFVENACVHGIESKATQGWIFVRVYKGEKELFIEVEDTGEGMTEDKVKEMVKDIEEASIETIKNRKHVGILNACLRLKMVTGHTVKFDIESEEGVGLSVIIRIPLDKLKKATEVE